MPTHVHTRSGYFVYTTAGLILPIITASISFLSSLTIVVFIIRSRNNTVYHRIMFLISIFDICSSIAIALSTLPMPPETRFVYPFAGPSYGSVLACEIQGFFYTTGYGMALVLGLVLNIYYVCKLRYNMKDAAFQKCIEPLLYAVSFTTMIIPGIFIWRNGGFNPTPHDPFCAVREYPMHCTLETDTQCRGSDIIQPLIFFFLTIYAAFGLLLISMGLIIASYFSNEREIKQNIKSLNNIKRQKNLDAEESKQINLNSQEQILELHHIRSSRKSVTKQAFLYISAFFLTWFSLFVETATRNHNSVAVVRFIFQPSQGLYNLMIFMYHKIDVAIKDDEDLTIWDALWQILKRPQQFSSKSLMIHNLDFIGAANYFNHQSPGKNGNASSFVSRDCNSARPRNDVEVEGPPASLEANSFAKQDDTLIAARSAILDSVISYDSPSESRSTSLGGFDGISCAFSNTNNDSDDNLEPSIHLPESGSGQLSFQNEDDMVMSETGISINSDPIDDTHFVDDNVQPKK